MPETARPVRRRRKEARPAELTAAALRLFVEKGFAATRLEDVASLAGVSKGTLYLYFDSKEALFKAVIREGVLPVVAAGESIAAAHSGGAFALLERLFEHWWEHVGNTPYAGLCKLIVAEAGNFPEVAQYYHEEVIVRACALVAQALERGMASGEFVRLDVPTTVDVIISPMLMQSIWQHSLACCRQGPDNPALFRSIHLDLLRRGLTASRL